MATSRRPDVDWLRVLATYLLFVFHAAMVFNPAPFYHVRNGELSFVMLVVCGFIGLWHMPLFFLLAGWSAAGSLRVRGARGFAVERVQRLLIPLLSGCVLLAPVIKYLELRSGLDLNHVGLRVAAALQPGFATVIPGGLPLAPPFDEPFLTFLPTFFTRLERFTWTHLWFVAYLFTFSLVYLPLLVWIRRRPDRLAGVRGWAVYAPLLPLVAVQLWLRPYWPGIYNLYDDWANVAYYSIFFLAGFLLSCHPALEPVVDREWKRALGVGGAATVTLLLAVLGLISSPTVLLVGSAVAAWCFVVALFGMARRLARDSDVLSYLSESALPVYVLHQSAIVLLGYWIVGISLGIFAKFMLLLVLSVACTLAVYEWLVRPFAVPRFLLGMRPAPALRPRLVSPRATAKLVLAATLLAAAPAAAATPIGRWYAEGGAAQVEIEPCGRSLCGHVVWLRSPFDDDGCELRDRYNPDPTLRARPVIGLQVLAGLEPRSDGTWTNGRIYDPGSGYTYTCHLMVDGTDRLRLRGYIGLPLIGRTTTWIRVGREDRLCRESAPAGSSR